MDEDLSSGYSEKKYETFLKINAVARKLALRECYLYPEGFDFRRCVYVENEDASGSYKQINADEQRWFMQACEVVKLLSDQECDYGFLDSIPLQTKNTFFRSTDLQEAHKECLKFRMTLPAYGYYHELYTNSMDSMLRDLRHYGILSESTIWFISKNLKELSTL